MTTDEGGDQGDVGGFTPKNAASIQTIDCTAADPIGPASHMLPRQIDPDNSDWSEGNPLLTGSVALTIDASIGKSRRVHKAEDTMNGEHGNVARRETNEDFASEPTRMIVGPPDGGLRAWMIMIGSFMINGVLFSIINTYSLIYPELQKRLTEAGEAEVSSKAALVGSLTIGMTFFLSPIAGMLTDKFGIQITTFVGGVIASAGLLLSSLLTDKVEVLYLTYGVMYGLGASLAYTPSLAILGHYFKKYLGLVNGIVTAGSSIFTTLIPFLIEYLLRHLGLEGTLRSLAALTTIIMACAILFKPIPLNTPQEDESQHKAKSLRNSLKEFINVSIWKRKRYVVWSVSIPVALFGYFVPYVHIGKFVTTTFKDADGKLPVMCIGITSGIGRLIFGYIADLPKVNRILLQQISFISIGILTMLLPTTKSFLVLLIISLGMGLFDGCFISLLGPIVFDTCGRSGATQAIGFLLGMCSIPLTVGPPIAGLLYDHTGTYDLPFFLAGIPPIVGALAMFLIRFVKDDESSNNPSPENPSSKIECQNEQKYESVAQDEYSKMYKNLQASERVKQQAALQKCLAYDSYRHEYSDHYKYSESVPLLHKRENPRYSTAGFFERSSTLTF